MRKCFSPQATAPATRQGQTPIRKRIDKMRVDEVAPFLTERVLGNLLLVF
jgi:hypothetical protein